METRFDWILITYAAASDETEAADDAEDLEATVHPDQPVARQ